MGMETVEVLVTAQEAFFIRARCRPFVYRPRGEKDWRLGWALPGVDVQALLAPTLGPLEIETQPKQRPAGMSVGAWQFELDSRRKPDVG